LVAHGGLFDHQGLVRGMEREIMRLLCLLNLVLYLGCIGRRSSDLSFLFFSLSLSLDGIETGIRIYIGMDMGGRREEKERLVFLFGFYLASFSGCGQRGGGGYIT
jgi:hypothetical protein